jgi:hypothetical protein
LGGQLAVSVSSWFGRNSASIAGSLITAAGPIATTHTGVLEDALTSYGDIVPTATLRWNQGVNNYMTYITGDIPAGDYSPMRLANIGIGHGAIDAGGGYTYSTRRRETNFPASPASPIISRTATPSTRAGSIFISIGAPRTSFRSSFSSAWQGMPFSRLPMTAARARFWALSGRAFSAPVRRSDIFSRSET